MSFAASSTPIVIVCSADRGYVRPLATTLVSALTNVERGRKIDVHVIDRLIADEDKERLTRSLGGPSVSFAWHSPDRTRFVGVPLWGRMPISTYDKFLVPELLCDCDRALWLDCDTLVLGDVGPLWDRGASSGARGASVLAVQDPLVPFVSSRFGVSGYKALGLSSNTKYFNAGVMLMNLARWRDERISDRALAYVKAHAHDVTFWDQEGLNAVLAHSWEEVDATWNFSVSLGWADGRPAIGRLAHIAHFSGNLKPWKYDGRHSYYPLYYDYVDRTPWPGVRPAETWRTAVLRAYERSALRRVLYPAERLATRVTVTCTKRLATPSDFAPGPGDRA